MANNLHESGREMPVCWHCLEWRSRPWSSGPDTRPHGLWCVVSTPIVLTSSACWPWVGGPRGGRAQARWCCPCLCSASISGSISSLSPWRAPAPGETTRLPTEATCFRSPHSNQNMNQIIPFPMTHLFLKFKSSPWPIKHYIRLPPKPMITILSTILIALFFFQTLRDSLQELCLYSSHYL